MLYESTFRGHEPGMYNWCHSRTVASSNHIEHGSLNPILHLHTHRKKWKHGYFCTFIYSRLHQSFSEEETENFASQVFSPGFLLIHDSSRRRQHEKTTTDKRQRIRTCSQQKLGTRYARPTSTNLCSVTVESPFGVVRAKFPDYYTNQRAKSEDNVWALSRAVIWRKKCRQSDMLLYI